MNDFYLPFLAIVIEELNLILIIINNGNQRLELNVLFDMKIEDVITSLNEYFKLSVNKSIILYKDQAQVELLDGNKTFDDEFLEHHQEIYGKIPGFFKYFPLIK